MFTEIEIKRIQKSLDELLKKRRPPPELRNRLDINYKIEKGKVEIFTTRPKWNDSSQFIESPIAKATFVLKDNIWKVYWQKSDLKWHSYNPKPFVRYIEEFVKTVDLDEFGCFWG
ncbi:DUF3024 domain-containing protein [Leptospira ilyithenensis]|uniref:DUF3024 domain-containing protein n=1 Tax=Leptospira ilyithenensis TaxID=2484901 RepID=A0A4R9LWT6_9LEPT|nr:DUF3024 domain-containing protein [Leptospira ilyithenensis]TGN14048.1 DUF3024 domain-containing protein [Leptospira ilyithenensis]